MPGPNGKRKQIKRQGQTLAGLRALRDNLQNTLRKRRDVLRAALAAGAAAAGEAEAAPPVAKSPAAMPEKAEGDLILASYNIHKCIGTDKIFNPQRIVEVIAGLDADILALQEVDKRFGARCGLLDLQDLYERSGLRPVPIHTISPQGQGWHGNALFYREGQVCSVEQLALPGIEPRGALIVDFTLKTGALRVIAAHFGLLRRSRALQAEAILSFLKTKQDMPTVLLGDLNEWRSGKSSSLNGLMPFFAKTAGGPSFPSRFPVLALDRVFSAPHNLVRSLAVEDTPQSRLASDHLPIKLLLRLPQASPVYPSSDS